MMRSLARKVLPLHDESSSCPGTARRRPSGASAPPTLSCGASPPGAAGVAAPGALGHGQAEPPQRLPEWLPPQRIVEQHVLDVLRAVFELHGFASVETRAVEPLDQLLRKGETDKEVYVLRRLQADRGTRSGRGRAAGSTLGPHFDLTVPLARSCWRTPGTSSSRSAATSCRRHGAGSGRRKAATGSSPRPTST